MRGTPWDTPEEITDPGFITIMRLDKVSVGYGETCGYIYDIGPRVIVTLGPTHDPLLQGTDQ